MMFLTRRLDMDKLVINLKDSHLNIIDQVDQIHQCIRSYNDVKPKLNLLQGILLNHFDKQKQKFYQELEEKYSDDREKRKLIEFLKIDLKDLKIKMLLFYEEHPADMGDVRPKRVIQDFEQLSQDLIGRVHHEKKYLLPLLEEAR